MTQYLMINHGIGKPADWDSFFRMLHSSGSFIGGSALDDGLSLRDHTFSPASSSTITGYILIQTESLDDAREIMLQNPVHLAGGTVDLFELLRT